MAKKNQKPVESESESTDLETSDEEPETNLTPNKNTHDSKINKPVSSEEESQSLSQSDSDSDSEPKLSNPKPITTVPPLTPSKRLAAAAETITQLADASKKPKIVETDTNASSKKVPFQRIWSEDDEIVILSGMIDFQAKHNVSATSELDAFLEFIKKKLHVDVSKLQLQGKIRKLRKRYENNKGKNKNWTKPHDKAALELSEKLWGVEKEKEEVAAANGSAVKRVVNRKGGKANKNVKKEAAVEVSDVGVEKKDAGVEKKDGGVEKKVEKKDVGVEKKDGGVEKKAMVGKMVTSFGLTNEEKLLRIGEEMFGGDEKIEGSEEWKKLEREDMKLSLKQLDVKRAKMKLVLDKMA